MTDKTGRFSPFVENLSEAAAKLIANIATRSCHIGIIISLQFEETRPLPQGGQ